jgi:hypothetical protein
MNLDRYQIDVNPDFQDFEFSSVGPKGTIRKMVRFTRMEIQISTREIYNLCFGDHNKTEDTIDDLIVSDNKDSQLILATVAAAIVKFTDKNPETLIFAQGSTPSRTRYYIMGISSKIEEIRDFFEIWGYLDDRWEQFQRNKRYTALLAKRK